MRIKIEKAIVFDRIPGGKHGWFPPIFSIIALVPDTIYKETFYVFLAGNMKKFSFSIKEFPESGLFMDDIVNLELIKTINPHQYLNNSILKKTTERIKWKKVN
jgi:hypothetical protein